MTYTPPSRITVRAQPYLNLRQDPVVKPGNIVARLADGSTWPVVGVAREDFDAQSDVLWTQIEFSDPAAAPAGVTGPRVYGFCHCDFVDPEFAPLPAFQQVLPDEGLNLRSSPVFEQTVNNKILTMRGGSIVRVLGGAWENFDPAIGKWWFFVEYEGQRGYAYARYLADPSSVTLTTKGLQAGAPMGDNGEIFFTDPVAAKIAESGAVWVRINFRLGPRFRDWTETTTLGFSALSRYDVIIDSAIRNGLRVLGLLSNETWNTANLLDDWQANNAEVSGGNGDNTYIQNFETNAARVLIPHFAGKIDHWQVWNEPNASLTSIYPSNFAWLLRRVYVAARESGVPNLTIVSGGLLSTHSQTSTALTSANTGADYLRDTYNQGKLNASWETIKSTYGSYPLDVIGQHLYIDQWGRAKANRIEKAMSLVHDAYVAGEGGSSAKTTHVTEMGWATSMVSERTQADNLSTAYTRLGQLAYTPRTYWFFLQDIPAANLFHGLLRSDGSEKRSWAAYRGVI